MSATLTTQMHLPPGTGEHMTVEGDGIHTRFTLDMVRELNNLGTYCNPKPFYLQGCQGGYVQSGQLQNEVSREYFIAQGVTKAPRGAKRLLWTAGLRPLVGAATVDITEARLYLSEAHYAGQVAPNPFDLTALSLGYLWHGVSIVAAPDIYVLAADTTTGIENPYLPHPGKVIGRDDLMVNFILTAIAERTNTGGDPIALINVEDFTGWWVWE